MSVWDEIKNDVAGAALLADWLGSGLQPVTQIRADQRAYACTSGNKGEPCPKNKEPNWWDRVKSTIATAIKGQIEVKNRLELHAANEANLHMCAVCGCCLQLKVWTPIEHIQRVTPPSKLKDAPSWCWMWHELLPP